MATKITVELVYTRHIPAPVLEELHESAIEDLGSFLRQMSVWADEDPYMAGGATVEEIDAPEE